MKKFFSMMVAVAAMFTFAACGGDDTTDPAPKPSNKTKLDQPVVTVAETGDDSFTITWEAIAGAKEYLVYLDKNNQPNTTETTYTFTNLNAGTYKPRVKAIGDGTVKDSDYSEVVSIEIKGATSVSWFTQTVFLPEDSDELAAKGINSSNTIAFNWKGDGIEILKYTYFFNDTDFAKMTEDQIIKEMATLEDEMLVEVNSAEGIDLQFTNMAGDTEYVICAYVVKGDKFFLDKKVIKTSPTVLTLGTQAWLGAWTAYTPQTVTMPATANDPYVFEDKRTDLNLSIESYVDEDEIVRYSNFVWVDGFSIAGEKTPAFGVISHESVLNATKDGYDYTGNYILDIMAFETIGGMGQDEKGNDIYAVWMPLCTKGSTPAGTTGTTGTNYTFVMGSFEAYSLVYNPTTGDVTCNPYEGKLSDESKFKVVMMDVFGYCPDTNAIYEMVADEETQDTFPYYLAGGILGATKAAASPSLASVAPKAMKAAALPASVVVAAM